MQIQVLAFNGIYEKDADKHESWEIFHIMLTTVLLCSNTNCNV